MSEIETTATEVQPGPQPATPEHRRLTTDEAWKQIQQLLATNGYAMKPVAIGKRTGQMADLADWLDDRFVAEIAIYEPPKRTDK